MLQALYPDRPDAAPTFAPAGETSSFGQMVVEAGNLAGNPAFGALHVGAQLATPAGRDLTAGAYQFSRLSRFVSSRDASLEEVADQRIAALKQATGVELENPYRKGYFIEARKRVRERMYDQDYDWHLGIPGAARQIFDERVAELAPQAPGLDLKPLEDAARALASGAEDAMPGLRERATAAGVGGTAQFLAELAGSAGAGLRDPITQTSMVVGPVGAVGKTLLMRALSDGGVQGLFNVGLAIYEHPSIAAWREERGRDGGGPLPTMAETATAFLAGAIPGAGLRVLFESLPKLRVNIPEEAVRAGERSAAADERLLAERPAGVTPDDQVAALTQMQRHEADPAHEPPPPLPAIEAYHASPHDFDAFSIEKIGTGEGAQSYGHGLYYAENRAVGDEYFKNFQGGAVSVHLPSGVENLSSHPTEFMRMAGRFVSEAKGDLNGAIDLAKKQLAGGEMNSFLADDVSAAIRQMEKWKDGNYKIDFADKTTLYKVRILADREHFLDWDKPLSEQSPGVQAALERLGVKDGGDFIKAGQEILAELGDKEQASAALREAGIPGIKYLDQGSRRNPERAIELKKLIAEYDGLPETGVVADLKRQLAEQETPQTSNFVLFDDNLVEITEKNGVPVARDPVKVVEAMRDDPALARASSASDDPAMRDAAKMSTLSDGAWQAVRDGNATPEHGLIAAEQARNPDDHLPILERLAAEHPIDTKEARVVAADEVAAQASKRETFTLEESFAQGAEKIPPQEMPPAIAAAGERPSLLADLVRSCQD